MIRGVISEEEYYDKETKEYIVLPDKWFKEYMRAKKRGDNKTAMKILAQYSWCIND